MMKTLCQRYKLLGERKEEMCCELMRGREIRSGHFIVVCSSSRVWRVVWEIFINVSEEIPNFIFRAKEYRSSMFLLPKASKYLPDYTVALSIPESFIICSMISTHVSIKPFQYMGKFSWIVMGYELQTYAVVWITVLLAPRCSVVGRSVVLQAKRWRVGFPMR
jgi:hypothetical protein